MGAGMVDVAGRAKNVLVTVAFIVLGPPGWVVGYFPRWITGWQIADQGWGWRLLAGGMIVVGLLPLGESLVRFVRVGRGTLAPAVPTESLVVSGFYRYVRNPMYLGLVILSLGIAFWVGAWPMFIAPIAVFATANWVHIPFEEGKMRRQFGATYESYVRRVRRWL